MKKILNIVTITVTTCVLIGITLGITATLFYIPISATGMESLETVVKNDVSNVGFVSSLYVKVFIVFLAIIAVTRYKDTVAGFIKK